MNYKSSGEINDLVNYAISALDNKNHVFITGEKSSGKSYLLNKLLTQLESKTDKTNNAKTYNGIITKAIRDDKFFPKNVVLYNVWDKTQNEVVATRNNSEDGLIVNIDGFNITGREILTACRQSSTKYIIIDEVGILESGADLFKREVLHCLDEKQMILVLRKADSKFLNGIKAWENAVKIDLG